MSDNLSKLKMWWAGLHPDAAYCAGNDEFAKDVLALMQRCEQAERERDEASPVLEAAREQVKQSKRWSGGHGHDDYLMAAYHTEQAVAAHDAARAAGGGGDE